MTLVPTRKTQMIVAAIASSGSRNVRTEDNASAASAVATIEPDNHTGHPVGDTAMT